MGDQYQRFSLGNKNPNRLDLILSLHERPHALLFNNGWVKLRKRDYMGRVQTRKTSWPNHSSLHFISSFNTQNIWWVPAKDNRVCLERVPNKKKSGACEDSRMQFPYARNLVYWEYIPVHTAGLYQAKGAWYPIPDFWSFWDLYARNVPVCIISGKQILVSQI